MLPAARGDWESRAVAGSPAPLAPPARAPRVRSAAGDAAARRVVHAAPASAAGRKVLDAAMASPGVTRRTALAHVPGAPESGLASVCRVRGLTWGPARLGPVHYERRVSIHSIVTRWGGLPWQEPWVVMLGPEGDFLEWDIAAELPNVRVREGLYQIPDPLTDAQRGEWMARTHASRPADARSRGGVGAERVTTPRRRTRASRLVLLVAHRRRGGAAAPPYRQRRGLGDRGRRRDVAQARVGAPRRRGPPALGAAHRGQAVGIVEWSWPVAEIEQELRAGAVRVKLTSHVDVARGQPAPPHCPHCDSEAEMLVRIRGSVACPQCA